MAINSLPFDTLGLVVTNEDWNAVMNDNCFQTKFWEKVQWIADMRS